MELILTIAPILLLIGGGISIWISNRCRGKNAHIAFRYGAWGIWLLLLLYLPISIFPWPLGLLNTIISVIPSAFCFLMAVNTMLKEIRAQQQSEYTETIR